MNGRPLLANDLDAYLGQPVVVDTDQPVVYLGTLHAIAHLGIWLEGADMHDCRDGHATKEAYVYEASVAGIRTNRKRVFVMQSAIISISALTDVVAYDE